MEALYGRVVNIKPLKSQGVTRIEIEIPVEYHVQATGLLFDQDVLVVVRKMESAYGILMGGSEAMIDVVPKVDEHPFQEEPAARDKKVLGPFCKLAVRWCKEPVFWKWISIQIAIEVEDEDSAADFVKVTCHVESRYEIDHVTSASKLFNDIIRQPFNAWLKETGGDI